MDDGKKKRVDKLYRFGTGSLPGEEPEVMWLHADGLKEYMVKRPVGPLPHPDGLVSPQGSGYPADWHSCPMVHMTAGEGVEASAPLPVPDLQDGGGVYDWIVSDRGKAFFEEIDPEAFAFSPIKVLIGKSLVAYEGPPYWRCDVVRFLDAIDYDKTEHKTEVFPNGIKRISPSLWDRNYFKRSVIGDCHIFRLPYRPDAIWCDAYFRDGALAKGLSIGFQKQWGEVVDE